MSSSVKVTTYNVLSSHLSGENHFTSCEPKWLDPKYRLNLVKQKLEKELEDKAVVCLQEISHKWVGALHPFFASRGYHFVTGLYGNKFNGYMGVGVAVPTDTYEIMDVSVQRIADTKQMQRKPKPTLIEKILNRFSGFFLFLAVKLGLMKPKIDFWDNVLYRTNQMVCARLRQKSGGESAQPFVVGTYHMPCMFKLPSVMVTHCSLSAQHIKRYANGDPFIYMGDFNIKPDSSQYELLTRGTLDKQHPDYPEIEAGDKWLPDVEPPLMSAYATANGQEPDFTNYAKVRDDPVFVETLDYIFYSDGWDVKSVEALPHRDSVPGPLPNEDEPSDHILISADMELQQSK
mmetsp:Transcript_1496/g.2472  ORF Transcript_1496/g.2472 Transcript_1496/m.2472 type:complete len:346 (-) Transcript_1496:962-1999(-)